MATLEALIEPSPSVQLGREQILQATSRSLREFGYDGTTIRRIAGLLGCAVGSIYRYFSDKRDLLLTVSQQTLEPVAAMVTAGGAFEQSVRLYHQVVTHDPESYRLMFWLAGPDAGGTGRASRLPGVVQQVVSGWAKQFNDVALAYQCWSLLHGFVLLGRDAEEALVVLRIAMVGSKMPAAVDKDMPAMVVTMKQPPKPAPVHVEEAWASSPRAEPQDDVCLL